MFLAYASGWCMVDIVQRLFLCSIHFKCFFLGGSLLDFLGRFFDGFRLYGRCRGNDGSVWAAFAITGASSVMATGQDGQKAQSRQGKHETTHGSSLPFRN